MTVAQAIRLLDPATTAEAIAEIEYYHGFSGRTAAVQAITDASIIACDIMRKYEQLERERDAAVKDMVELMQLGKFCCYCKHLTEDGECTKDLNGIDTEMLGKPGGWWCWEWRGAQEVE